MFLIKCLICFTLFTLVAYNLPFYVTSLYLASVVVY